MGIDNNNGGRGTFNGLAANDTRAARVGIDIKIGGGVGYLFKALTFSGECSQTVKGI